MRKWFKLKMSVILLMLCLLQLGCSSIFTIGQYGFKNNPNNFEFFADSTFKYISAGLIRKRSSGNWTISKGFIVLNSYNQQDSFSTDVRSYNIKTHDITINLKLDVKGINNGCPELVSDKDYICTPIINDFHNLDINRLDYGIRGSFVFKLPKPIKSLSFLIQKSPLQFCSSIILYEPIKTRVIKLNPNLSMGDSLCIKVEIIDSLFNYRIFKNFRFIPKHGNKILFKENNKIKKIQLKN